MLKEEENEIWSNELPNRCRKCDLEFDRLSYEFKRGVFEIPSIREIIQWYDIKNTERKLNPNHFLYYCCNCFIRKTLQKKDQCGYCGFFTEGRLKEISKNSIHPDCQFLPNKTKLCDSCKKILYEKNYLYQIEDLREPISEKDIICSICLKSKDLITENETSKNIWNKFINENTFYANDGKKKELLNNDLIFKHTFPCYVCNDCIQELPLESEKFISCDLCLKSHTILYEIDGMGDGCCSEVTEYDISCGYGSKYDCDRFSWTCGIMPDDFKHKENICDNCLHNLSNNGILTHHPEGS